MVERMSHGTLGALNNISVSTRVLLGSGAPNQVRNLYKLQIECDIYGQLILSSESTTVGLLGQRVISGPNSWLEQV